MCQLYAEIHKSSLYSVNCHLHSESADFLGGLRPVRSHSEVSCRKMSGITKKKKKIMSLTETGLYSHRERLEA